MAKTVNVSVSLDEVGGNFTRLVKRFIKKCKKERIVEEYVEKSRYTKPSVQRRLDKEKARRNAKKAEREREKRLNRG